MRMTVGGTAAAADDGVDSWPHELDGGREIAVLTVAMMSEQHVSKDFSFFRSAWDRLTGKKEKEKKTPLLAISLYTSSLHFCLSLLRSECLFGCTVAAATVAVAVIARALALNTAYRSGAYVCVWGMHFKSRSSLPLFSVCTSLCIPRLCICAELAFACIRILCVK